ncbi:MAG: imidazole glycerol phosphate synthase subunit HisH [Rickettsiales bacterium]|nr:imidazole glycerol phosphate synthase subunit HisH [Rickettsiales bacterium]
MSVAIIDYGSGNLRSVAKAFERIAAGKQVVVTNDPAALKNASHIVLPGVGAFADCMRGLKQITGMIDALEEQVLEHKKPFLGICVGMQMLFQKGHEHGLHDGLGWLIGEVVALPQQPHKIPHMGWNTLAIKHDHPLLKGIQEGAHAYFVHSYHAVGCDRADVLATVDYGQEITAIVARGNIIGTQFHPEKSQATGLALLKNFVGIAA